MICCCLSANIDEGTSPKGLSPSAPQHSVLLIELSEPVNNSLRRHNIFPFYLPSYFTQPYFTAKTRKYGTRKGTKWDREINPNNPCRTSSFFFSVPVNCTPRGTRVSCLPFLSAEEAHQVGGKELKRVFEHSNNLHTSILN